MTHGAAAGRDPDGVERAFRDVSGQAVATLVRVFGDITLAEDAVQDAFTVAADRWPRDGIPPNPAGWIVTTARNRAVDVVRRSSRRRELRAELAATSRGSSEPADQWVEDGPVNDDFLCLIFTCCHPALRVEHRVALALRLLGGLSVEEVARSFLVTPAAMAKRLVRAKHKIKAANIPYRIPSEADLPERLQAVLSVLYLVYNTGVDGPGRSALRAEAIRLCRSLDELMPDEPEAAGLLALMLLNESRAAARAAGNDLVLLRDQDRDLWDRSLIDEGHRIVRACIRRDRPGPFQLQAAIQAVHCSAGTFEATDWEKILLLYDRLFGMLPTPVVDLNRAIALGEVAGPAAALDRLDGIGPDVDDYHLLHAARGEMLHRLGRRAEAGAAYERALALAATEVDRRFLSRRLAGVAEVDGPTADSA